MYNINRVGENRHQMERPAEAGWNRQQLDDRIRCAGKSDQVFR